MKIVKLHYGNEFFLGTCLLINSYEGCQDKLWCLSSDLTPFSPVLSEILNVAGLDGIVWSLEKYGSNPVISSVIPEPPLLVTQHYESMTKYVCLTDKVSSCFKKKFYELENGAVFKVTSIPFSF